MRKKYIIELEDKPFHKGNGDFLYRVKGFKSLVFDMTGISKLTPYTESNLEQVRKEAYEQGLSDAWEAARKIASNNAGQNYSIFGQYFTGKILNTHSASEAIEKIQAYEQKKEEQKEEKPIPVEDVMRQYLDMFCKECTCEGCVLHDFTCGNGTYFLSEMHPMPDEEVRRAYAEVLKKMQEETK